MKNASISSLVDMNIRGLASVSSRIGVGVKLCMNLQTVFVWLKTNAGVRGGSLSRRKKPEFSGTFWKTRNDVLWTRWHGGGQEWARRCAGATWLTLCSLPYSARSFTYSSPARPCSRPSFSLPCLYQDEQGPALCACPDHGPPGRAAPGGSAQPTVGCAHAKTRHQERDAWARP